MRIFLLSLVLLVVGLNQILARSLPWIGSNAQADHWWNDNEYDLFSLTSNQYDDDLQKFLTAESSEESKETIKPLRKHQNNEIGNFLGVLVDSFLQDEDSLKTATSEENTDNKKRTSIQTDSDESDHNDNFNGDKNSNQFDILLYNPFTNIYENKEPKSSEEKKNDDDDEDRNKSSEESLFSIITDDKSDEESKEETPTENVEIEISDLTKSSEEKKDVNLSENDIKELTSLLITLSALEDVINIANKNPEHINDDLLKAREVDEYLSLFGSVLDKILEDELNSKENKVDDDDDKNNNDSDESQKNKNSHTTTQINDSDEGDDNNNYTTTAPKNNDSNEDSKDDDDYISDSDESQEDKSTTTPINDSDEFDNNNYYTATTHKNDSNEDNSDDDDDKTDDTNASNSNENKLNLISVVFQGLNEKNLNDHKYEVIELVPHLKPTTAPYMPELAPSSSSDDHDVIQEYVELREDLDSQQDSLQNNEMALDKDFYTIITNNYDNESISKFEKDVYVVQENLDRIKRNINAMQNLHSKLYFHKLITAAVKDVQNKSKE